MTTYAKPDVFKSMHQLAAHGTFFMAGGVNAWCTVLWIGERYETRPYPRAPWHVVEYRRQSVLRNTQTGQIMIYEFRDMTAEGRWRMQERRAG